MLQYFDVDFYGASFLIAVNKGYYETSSFLAWLERGINLL